MKQPIDHFSKQSGLYARFRPTYPPELYEWLLGLVEKKECAWDCGTGNGQVATVLADHFRQVYATDISQAQLDKAMHRDNIVYRRVRGEQTAFEDHSFDLITVAQALHWFDHEAFNQEVLRLLKPGGILAVWGYSLLRILPEIDELVDHYYNRIIGPYWAAERRHVDEQYRSIPFPFDLLDPPTPFFVETQWTLEQMEGYLHTWSSLQTYLHVHTHNPVPQLILQIRQSGLWQRQLPIRFPIFTKVGKNPSNYPPQL